MGYEQYDGEFYLACCRENTKTDYYFKKIRGSIFEVKDNDLIRKFGIYKTEYGFVIIDIVSGTMVTDYYEIEQQAMDYFIKNKQLILDTSNELIEVDCVLRKFVVEIEKINRLKDKK